MGHADRKLYQSGAFNDYRNAKIKLPAITFSGVFDGVHSKENFTSYSQLIVLDIDHLAAETIDIKKRELFQDPYVLAAWTSPSGSGIKLLFKTNTDSQIHKFTFDRICDYVYTGYNIEVDVSGSDICRLCFISYDEDLLYKSDCLFFPESEDGWLISSIAENQESTPLVTLRDKYAKTEKILLYKTEGRNSKKNRELIKNVIIYLRKNNLSITGSHKEWVKVAYAIANSFTYDIGRTLFLQLCRLDKDGHDEYKSELLLEYCYRKRRVNEVNFSSIIYLAKAKGFVFQFR